MRTPMFWVLAVLVSSSCSAQTIIDTNHIEVSPGVVRVGKDIAYVNDEDKLVPSCPDFVLSSKEGIKYDCETTKLKVHLGSSSSSWPIQLGYQGKLLKARLAGFAYYNSSTDSLRVIAEPDPSGVQELTAPGCLYQREFLPGTDQVWQINCEGFYTAFTLKNLSSLPAAQGGETHLASLTEFDFSSLLPYRILFRAAKGLSDYYQGSDISGVEHKVNQVTSCLVSGDETRNRRLRISLPLNGTYQLHFSFDDDKVWDSTAGDLKERLHPKKMLRRIEGRDYLVEMIPLSYLQEATCPVSLGWSVMAGVNPNPEEVFFAGTTYVVDGLYQVKSLTSSGSADNPVFVKFLPRKKSKIQVTRGEGQGVKVDYTVFTSAYDSHPRRGAAVEPVLFGLSERAPRAGDYYCALSAIKGKAQSVKNSQIYYASIGLSKLVETDQPLELKNVLIEDCDSAGVILTDWGTFANSTIRNCSQGAAVTSSSSGSVFNSIFAGNKTFGCSGLPQGAALNNVFYYNRLDTKEGYPGENALVSRKRQTSPFSEGIWGDCYLNLRSRFAKRMIDSAYGTAVELDLLSLSDSTTRTDNQPDTEPLDRGFHYPRQ